MPELQRNNNYDKNYSNNLKRANDEIYRLKQELRSKDKDLVTMQRELNNSMHRDSFENCDNYNIH
jgi:hypothetical protein